jgi:hypothetical protein
MIASVTTIQSPLNFFLIQVWFVTVAPGSAVVKTFYYEPEGRGFEMR